MIISEKLKERFCMDYKIPINIFIEPYFSERLELYNRFYDTKKKWERFVKELEKYSDEQSYFEEYNRVKDEAINSIKSSDGYRVFNVEDMSRFEITHKNLPKKDIYKPSNDKRIFISIDIKKANFSCLKYYEEGIFDEALTWEDFIRKFTGNEHIVNSKYIRQVILGNCNPGRHITYEKYITDRALTVLENDDVLKEKGLSIENVVFFSNDEIVLDITEIATSEKQDERILGHLAQRIYRLLNEFSPVGVPFKVEVFKLHKIKGLDTGYLKDGMEADGSLIYDLKGIDGYMMPIVIRSLRKQEVTDNDKIFYHNGLLSKFIEIPEIKI